MTNEISKLRLSNVMLMNGWASYFGLYFIPDYSLIFLVVGFISITYSLILNLQLINIKYLSTMIKSVLYFSIILIILLTEFRWLIIIITIMFLITWWGYRNAE